MAPLGQECFPKSLELFRIYSQSTPVRPARGVQIDRPKSFLQSEDVRVATGERRRARWQQPNRESAWPNENAQPPSPTASGRSVSKLTTLFMDDELLAHSIMAVDPDLMAMSPTPMSGDPNVVTPAIPIPRSMHVVRSIPNVDTDPDRIRGRSKTAQAKQYCQK